MVTLIYLYNNSFEDKDAIYTNEDDDHHDDHDDQ